MVPEPLFLPQLFSLSSSDTLTTPPHRYVDSDLHRFPSLGRGLVHFSTSWLCCYVFLRFEWLPTPDSALPTGVVRHGGTMTSADSRQTVCSAALSRFSRASQDKTCSFLTVQAGSTMRTLDRVLGISIHRCLTSCALAFYPVLVHPVCDSPPASSPPHVTVTQLPLAI